MTKFYITLAFCLLLIPFIAHTSWFAVGASTALYTHFVYMFGHSGWLHWAVNAWSLLMLHNAIRWYRLLAAYVLSVLLSFVYLPALPVVGISVFVVFLLGMAATQIWRRDRWALGLTMGLLLMGCFLPGFAGVYHVVMFCLGFAFYRLERLVRRFVNYAQRGNSD